MLEETVLALEEKLLGLFESIHSVDTLGVSLLDIFSEVKAVLDDKSVSNLRKISLFLLMSDVVQGIHLGTESYKSSRQVYRLNPSSSTVVNTLPFTEVHPVEKEAYASFFSLKEVINRDDFFFF